MPEDKLPGRGVGGRTRSKTFLRLDRKNAYAEIGISPLASTEEIEKRIGDLRGKAMKRVRSQASGSAEDECEIERLDRVHEQIGDPRKRKSYDERYPQNILLTVQPSATEQVWLRHRRAGLISEWIYGVLGETAFVPTPACVRLWAPSGLDQAMIEFLEQYVDSGPVAATPDIPPEPLAEAPTMSDLDRFIKET